jgi:hypothetical protein
MHKRCAEQVSETPRKRAPDTQLLTDPQARALRRIRDLGSMAWCDGSRAGGAIARMFNKLVDRGLCTSPPYLITDLGREAVGRYYGNSGEAGT